MPELSVEISGDIQKLQGSLKKATKDLKTFDNKTEKFSKGLSDSAKTATKGMGNLQKGTVRGTSAVVAFNRTIQDAPFGIMGVSNNITNLTEQFGFLRAKTGSAGGALKAMLKDLKGFGGISFIISLATSLLLVFGDKLFKTKDKAKALKEEQEKLTESLNNYVDGLEAVNSAQLKGSRNAVKEITNLRMLKGQIEDTTLSTRQRLGAVDELRRKYPSYLKNISDEEALNGALTKTYDKLTVSILKRARATAATNAIIKNTEKLLVLEDQLLGKKSNVLDVEQEIAKLGRIDAGERTKAAKAYEKLNRLRKEALSIEGQIQNLELTNIDLEETVNAVGLASAIVPERTSDVITRRIKDVLTDVKASTKEEIGLFNEEIAQTPLVFITPEAVLNMRANAERIRQELLKLNEEAKSIIQGSLVSTFQGIGEALGNAFASGLSVIRDLGSAVLGGLGSLLSAMGDKLIQLGTAAVLAGTVVKLFGKISGIGAGLAAIAGGVILKGIGSGLSSAARSSSGTSGGASSNTSTFQPSSGSSGFSGSGGFGSGTVVFEIQGTKLVGVLSNTLRRNRNLGGSLQIVD